MTYPFDTVKPDFDKLPDGLIPAIIQDRSTQKVLMLGYMNNEALERSINTGLATFFSRSRQQLWVKGETSGHFLHIQEIGLDCDRDCLLVQVLPTGPVCHTGADTCWNESNQPASFLAHLESTITSRIANPSETSYTSSLVVAGIPKIAQKVGEEAVETVIEALGERKDLFLNECADLLYHLLVLLAAKKVSLSDVEDVLRKRHSTYPQEAPNLK
jgi:phosphoribosyl-ATP pyrophosphohydrolase/phosphoribosyl-AMP cyclohydrolase